MTSRRELFKSAALWEQRNTPLQRLWTGDWALDVPAGPMLCIIVGIGCQYLPRHFDEHLQSIGAEIQPVLRGLGNLDYDWQLQPGHYVLDIMGAGNQFVKISEAWNLQGGADTRVGVDVVAKNGTTSTMDITTVEYIPLRAG